MLRWIIWPTANPSPNTLTGFLRSLKRANSPSVFHHFRSVTFTTFWKLKGHVDALTLLGKLKLLVRVSAVGDTEIQSALSSSFKDFEDGVQHFAAKREDGISAIVTRNKGDYSPSEISVLSPEEYLAKHEPAAQ